MKVRILGIPIDGVTRKEALERVAAAVKSGRRPFFVVTPNPEFMVMAKRDKEFAAVLRSADMAIPDGQGMLWAARRIGRPLPERVTGTDLMQDVCAWAAENGRSVFLLGGAPKVAWAAADKLLKRHPNLNVLGATDGGRIQRGRNGEWRIRPADWDRLVKSKPDILFVAFGHGKQEKWIASHLEKMPWLKCAMGIGGAFDFISGRVKRAPPWFSRHGLEWLWRLITQPWRWRRIFDAVVVFPLLVREAGEKRRR